MMPIIAGVSYEVLKLAYARQKSKLINLLVLPGLMFQKITTRPPERKHLEVAIAVVKEAMRREKVKSANHTTGS